MALVASWCRGQFRGADAFIAFLGLEVRVKQSVRWQVRCKLTRKGAWNEPHRRAGGAEPQTGQGQVSLTLLRTDTRFVPVATEKACVST
jgi:hypothetical protein